MQTVMKFSCTVSFDLLVCGGGCVLRIENMYYESYLTRVLQVQKGWKMIHLYHCGLAATATGTFPCLSFKER